METTEQDSSAQDTSAFDEEQIWGPSTRFREGDDDRGPGLRARRGSRLGRLLIRTGALVLALLVGLMLGRFLFADSDARDRAGSTLSVDTTQSSLGDGATLADVIEEAMPSVVSIQASSTVGFGQQMSAEGSGVVIREDGIILTNAHVVDGASQVEVTLSDGAEALAATVVGSDAEHDIAILKVDAGGLPAMTIGTSEDLELGDPVVALGFPLGLGKTATQGIVSGLDRTITVSEGPFRSSQMTGLLQTDAAINPGNSGGALLDASGRLIGINTAAASASAAENVGFAVAIDEVLPIIEDLLANA